MKNRGGFTLLELLIVVSLFSLIAGVVALLFARGRTVYRHGETNIEMQRSGRYISARLTPYFASAYDGETPTNSPIIGLATGASQDDFVRFVTTEDWLSPNYPSPDTSSLQATSTADLNSFLYEIRRNGQEIVLNRLDPTTLNVTNDQTLRLPRQDETIESFRFTHVRENLLLLEMTLQRETRGDANNQRTMQEDIRLTFSLPNKDS